MIIEQEFKTILLIGNVKLLLTVLNQETRLASGISSLAKVAGLTYSHAVISFKKLEELGLITAVKNGRIRDVKLTPKGRVVTTKLHELRMEII